MAKFIIGIMGPGNATRKEVETALELGRLIAQEGWILLTGGRNTGVMEAASKGAKELDGITVGIIPDSSKEFISEYVDIPVITGMGSARNNINILSSDAVIACGCGAGTISEIMLALKAEKPVILLHPPQTLISLLQELAERYPNYQNLVHPADTPGSAVTIIKTLLK